MLSVETKKYTKGGKNMYVGPMMYSPAAVAGLLPVIWMKNGALASQKRCSSWTSGQCLSGEPPESLTAAPLHEKRKG